MTSPPPSQPPSDSPPKRRRPAWRYAWIALILVPLFLLSAYHFHYGLERSYVHGYADFPIFAEQARDFLETGVLYPDAEDAVAWEPGAHVYKYPPFYVLWLLPFVDGGVPDALYSGLWWLILILYAAICAFAVYLFPGKHPEVTLLAMVLMALNFEPFLETLWHLQLETPFLLAFLIVILAYRRGHDLTVGAIIGLCGSLKVYPAFLLVYFAVRGSWRVVGAAVATAILCVVASFAVIGKPPHLDYFLEILPVMLGEAPSLITKNQGLARYVVDVTGWSPEIGKRVGQLFAIGLFALSFVCVRRNRPFARDREVVALQFAMFLGLMTLTMPNFWSHYQVMLLLPFFVVLHRLLKHGGWGGAAGWLLVLGYLSTLFYSPCAPLSAGFPCAQTPHVFGLFQLPRSLHDVMVHLKVFANVAAWLAPLVLLWNWADRHGPTAREAA